MRIAILSDPHANLRAWNAVLADIANAQVDRILCLGDLVGYGPSPVEVMQSAYQHVHAFVLGNHDAVVAGKMSPDVFNDRARRLILWTRTRIGRRGVEFLSTLPLVLSGEGYRCSHANFDRPSAYGYILEPEDAAASWAVTEEQLLFVGHTHEPKLFVMGASGTPHRLPAQDFVAESGKRYIVNVGSVGLPRDTDGRASYVIYDDQTHSVRFRRVPFDLDAFRNDVLRAGLDPADVPLLRNDPRQKLATLREEADFSPATRKEDEAQGVVETASAEIASARRKAAHWRGLAALGALLVLILAGVLVVRTRQAAPEPFSSPAAKPTIALTEPLNASLLPAFPEERAFDGGLPPWGLTLSDARRISIELLREPAARGGWEQFLRFQAKGSPQTVRLESPEFQLDGPKAPELLFEGTVIPGDDFLGQFTLFLEVRKEASSEFTVQETIPFATARKSETTLRASRRWSGNSDRIRGVASFRIVLEGSFTGSAMLPTPRLTPKEASR